MTIHRDLADSELHEPKGVAGASAGEVYVADGAGSGAWTDAASLEPIGIAGAGANEIYVADGAGSGTMTALATVVAANESANIVHLTGVISDVSTAGFILIPIVEDCTVNSVTTALSGAITVADATISVTRGGDAASLGNITVAFTGSAEGDIDTLTPASNNTLTSATHKYLKIATDGGSTDAAPLYVTVKATLT